MNGMNYTPEMINFLKGIATTTKGIIAITDLFNKEFNTNVTYQQISRALKLRNIKYKTNVLPPLGSEFVIKRSSTTYIKISHKGLSIGNRRGTWVLKHNFLWEKTHGSIQKGYIVIFLDKNKFNFDIDNLALATANELWLLNKYELYHNDKEMTKTGLAIIRHRLTAIKSLTRGMGEKEKRKFYKKEAMKKNAL